MTLRSRAASAFLGVLLLAGPVLAQDEAKAPLWAEPRVNLAAGESFKLERDAIAWVTQQTPDGDVRVKREAKAWYRFDVQEVREDGVMILKGTYERFVYAQESDAGKSVSDTAIAAESPETDPVAAFFRELAGQTFTVEMARTGRVTAVQGSEIAAAYAMSRLETQGRPLPGPLRGALVGEYREAQSAALLDAIFGILPNAAVGAGDSWRHEVRFAGSLAQTVESTWSVVSAESGVLSLACEAVISPNEEAPALLVNGIELTTTVTGAQSGKATVDTKTGLPLTLELKGSVSGHSMTGGQLMIPINREHELRATVTLPTK